MQLVTPVVRARWFVRKMRGESQAHLIEADDKQYYVVKFLNNRQGSRILVNELLASFLLNELHISTPETRCIEVDDAFLRANPEAFLTGAGRRVLPVAGGVHFGSRYPGAPEKCAVYDFLPDPWYRRLYNRSEFLGALAFDKWISNADGRQAVFFQMRGQVAVNQPNKHWGALMIDHGGAFQGNEWTFRDSPVQGLYPRAVIYGRRVSMLEMWPWLEAIAKIRREVLDRAAAAIPRCWIAGEEDALKHLLNRLYERRCMVRELVSDSVDWIRDRGKARQRACQEEIRDENVYGDTV